MAEAGKDNPDPIVSVVIPTHGRPQWVGRAVAGALAQTLREIEVVVVIDGPSAEAEAVLRAIPDPRLRIVPLPENRGPAMARNAGVDASRAPWIAFLDDDDEWLPEKLSRQIAAARQSAAPLPLVSCRAVVQTPRGKYCWPRRLPDAGESIGDYLFRRTSLFLGETFLLQSSLMVPRELFERIRYRHILAHEDWDWMLRVSGEPGVAVAMVPDSLCVYYTEERRPSWGSIKKWRASFAWAAEMRRYMGRRAYAGLCLIIVGSEAAAVREWRAFFPVLGEAFRHGLPTPLELFLYVTMWAIPIDLRRTVRARLTALRR